MWGFESPYQILVNKRIEMKNNLEYALALQFLDRDRRLRTKNWRHSRYVNLRFKYMKIQGNRDIPFKKEGIEPVCFYFIADPL